MPVSLATLMRCLTAALQRIRSSGPPACAWPSGLAPCSVCAASCLLDIIWADCISWLPALLSHNLSVSSSDMQEMLLVCRL